MDDLALIFPSRAVMQEQCNKVIFTLERLGLRVNLPKCDWMPSKEAGGQTPLPLVAGNVIPPSQWLIQDPPEGLFLPPPRLFEGRISQAHYHLDPSTHVIHLGHVLTPSMDHTSTLPILQPLQLQEIKAYHNRPIPVYGRLKVLNQILLPRFIYQMECLPPAPEYLTFKNVIAGKVHLRANGTSILSTQENVLLPS